MKKTFALMMGFMALSSAYGMNGNSYENFKKEFKAIKNKRDEIEHLLDLLHNRRIV